MRSSGPQAIPVLQLGTLLAIVNVLALAVLIGVPENPTRFLKEFGPVTFLSGLHLLVAARLAQVIYRNRPGKPLIWALMAWGFLYLAADEMFELHENIDRGVHAMLHMQETSWTDRIDDAIIGVYGIIGLVAMYIGRAELVFFRRQWPFFAAGFVCLAVYVALDIATNDRVLIDMFVADAASSVVVQDWLTALEDSVKIIAEFFFVVALLRCWSHTLEELGRAGPGPGVKAVILFLLGRTRTSPHTS